MQQDKFKQISNDLMIFKKNVFLANEFDHNPIAKSHKQFNQDQIAFFIQQWALVANRYITNLVQIEKTISNDGWEIVVTMIQEIIADELGRHTQGATHYEVLTQGLNETLSVDFSHLTPSKTTETLFKKMDHILSKQTPYIIGTLYAIEAKAIDELLMFKQLMLSLSKNNLSKTMQIFLDGHINEWEITHLENLNNSIYKYLIPEDYDKFRSGFEDILLALNAWWININQETLRSQETTTA
ncbi:DUF3865 domain-containing protein [Piscirickettsia litoralis]|uniref:Uncharacterized protein n=1 Tax=Piscirickettsia litoralis TaxID=1891921 RepID=A0ABX2ZYM6_9GAMM|nr:DUF3865 domain-containing protein [Piscirickettsia litoralis]ODN41719.1 hypothetical protein BGC07_00365 [Piscirickettsia litoralis]